MYSYLYHSRKKSNNALCLICYPVDENCSIKEKELYSFIKEVYQGVLIKQFRSNRKEIDPLLFIFYKKTTI